MTFIKFTEYGAASRVKVTIRTNDLLFISRNILKQFNETAQFVYIHVDKVNHMIGIEFLSEKPYDRYFRKLSQEKAGVSINISPVLKFFGIKKVVSKYVIDYENKEGMLVFSINGLINK